MQAREIQASEFQASETRRWMTVALDEARAAVQHDDVPVGAVVVLDGEIIAARHNERELRGDPTAHAEVLALRDAAVAVGHWRLDRCTLVVTLEPCPMCAGAIVNARLGALVYGASDPKAGAAGSCFDLVDHPLLNHRVPRHVGVLADECGSLLVEFFSARRRSAVPQAVDEALEGRPSFVDEPTL
jgi:tRNA(adenine34) deaminase